MTVTQIKSLLKFNIIIPWGQYVMCGQIAYSSKTNCEQRYKSIQEKASLVTVKLHDLAVITLIMAIKKLKQDDLIIKSV